MQVKDAVEQYRYAILVHSASTQEWYLGRLKAFITWCEQAELHKNTTYPQGRVLALEDIHVNELRRYIHHLTTTPSKTTGQLLSSHTVHGHARTLRTFLHWCSQEDGLEHLVTEKTAKSMTMPKIEQKVIDVFTHEQLTSLFAACEKEYAPHLVVRDRAILSVLLDTGVRASELCELVLDNVHLDPHDAYIKVLGKGRKEREIGLGKDARLLLQKYISRYRNATHTVLREEKHVFLSRFCRPLTVNGLDQMLYRLGAWAHVEGVRVSAHTFRHTMAVEYLKNDGDIFKLSRLLGHTSVQITSDVYLKAFKAKDARADRLSVLDAMNAKKKRKGKPP